MRRCNQCGRRTVKLLSLGSTCAACKQSNLNASESNTVSSTRVSSSDDDFIPTTNFGISQADYSAYDATPVGSSSYDSVPSSCDSSSSDSSSSSSCDSSSPSSDFGGGDSSGGGSSSDW